MGRRQSLTLETDEAAVMILLGALILLLLLLVLSRDGRRRDRRLHPARPRHLSL